MSKNQELHPFRDLTFFVSTVMAILFSIGFIYETVYLEEFGLNNSELAPDPTTAIVFGFRYAFLNSYSAILSISMYGSLLFIFFSTLQSDFSKFVKSNSFVQKHLKGIETFLKKDVSPIPFYLGVIFLLTLIILHALFEGKKLGQKIKDEERIECITFSKNGLESIEGNVVRIRDNLVAFWEIESNQAFLLPQRQVVDIMYKSCPNKQLKQDK